MADETSVAVAACPEILPFTEEADKLAQRLDLPMSSSTGSPYALLLTVTPDRLELRLNGPQAPGPVFVDFAGGAVAFRRKHGGGRKQDLGRAIGLKANRCPSVIDATGGLARDSFVMATLGCNITLIERSPIIAALVSDGFRRAALDPETDAIISQHLRLVIDDSVHHLTNLADDQRPEVIYLDPMYPHRSKSALVKKEMRILRLLVGDDPDAPELLAAALACATERVVVKRPINAEPLAGKSPSMAIKGKAGRFDVYLIR